MKQQPAVSDDNPLLESTPLPDFDRIQPDHVAAAVDHLIGRWKQGLSPMLAQPEQANWAGFVAREEAMADRLDAAWSPVSHLHSVVDSPAWREAYGDAVLKLTEFHTELNQDRRRFQAYRSISQSPEYARLDRAQRRIIDNTLRDFRLSGIDLDDGGRQRFADIVRRLTELSTAFQQNVQDATDAWHKDVARLDGLPEGALTAARERAERAGIEGYRVNLEYPSYHAVMTYAEDRQLRFEMYQAYCTRASDQGPHGGQWDNGPVVAETLALRTELAQLLGFDTYAEYSLETKMAESPAQVEAFLAELVTRARPRAEQELAELKAYAVEQGGPATLEPWDVAFYSERLRKHRHDISDEETRPYFPLPAVLDGLLDVAATLFGVSFRDVSAEVSRWHDDVHYVEVLEDGQAIASVYIDAYAREGKRGGAWMADCRSLRVGEDLPGGRQLPVAFLTCNFPAPTAEQPSLLSHNEVTTLFHEFGHTLHHLLTGIEHPSVGGISGVEWDAVELPSQFLENWCWQREALDRFARHVDSGEPLPESLFQRLRDARHFQSGLFLCRQLEFGLTDLRMHQVYDPCGDSHEQLTAIQDAVRDAVAVIRPPTWSRSLNGFGHLFAGGYAAGYYSYLWAEQLSADAFDRFESEGVFNANTGADFRREVLAMGGSRDALESFTAFRGRPPEIGPLLKSYGID